MNVVELSDVARTYDDLPPVHALRQTNLNVATGDYVAVVGPSGSGKSTLLNLIGLLDRPTSGSIRIDGIDTSTLNERDRTALRGRKIGFVFQAFHLLPYRTVAENVALAQLYTGQPRRARADAARSTLGRVGLAHRLDALPTTLSGGERQRAAIARALVQNPSLLLCDEPTGNLDSSNSHTVMDLLDSLNADGVTVMVITHDVGVAARARCKVSISDGVVSHA